MSTRPRRVDLAPPPGAHAARSLARLACRTRQNNADLSILAGVRVNLDRSRMLFDNDVVSDGQAKAGAFACGLCREEGIEHLFPDLGRYSDAVVANPNLNFVTEVFGRCR